MDLEVRGMGSENKAKFSGKLKSYKDEVSRMESELVKYLICPGLLLLFDLIFHSFALFESPFIMFVSITLISSWYIL